MTSLVKGITVKALSSLSLTALTLLGLTPLMNSIRVIMEIAQYYHASQASGRRTS